MAKKNNNNLFFTCSLIEYIGRNRKQHRREITDYLGRENIKRIFNGTESKFAFKKSKSADGDKK